MTDAPDLRRDAREIFADALSSVDAGRAVRRAVRLDDSRLTIVDHPFDLENQIRSIYAVALGKAARPMAASLDAILGQRLAGGVLSAPSHAASLSTSRDALLSPPHDVSLPARWRTFAGGHPLPNDASLDAAHAALELLRLADRASALVIFLVSGGGSAMLELPCDDAITLDDLRDANRVLVSCGASIAEINAVRRALSAIKGGGLSRRAPRAAQATLIISDTGAGDAANVASGPTFPPPDAATDASAIVARYGLASKLPASILRAIERRDARVSKSAAREAEPAREVEHATRKDEEAQDDREDAAHYKRKHEAEDTRQVGAEDMQQDESLRVEPLRLHHVLLDNANAVERAAESAAGLGFTVEVARDVVEQPVEEGCAALVARLFELRRRMPETARGVCIISGGEFACPVRGAGTGGRNAESVLRWAFKIASADAAMGAATMPCIVAFSAGTDGIDGNSPAAGAIADDTTLARARRLRLDARKFLDASDAYTFFNALGDAVVQRHSLGCDHGSGVRCGACAPTL